MKLDWSQFPLTRGIHWPWSLFLSHLFSCTLRFSFLSPHSCQNGSKFGMVRPPPHSHSLSSLCLYCRLPPWIGSVGGLFTVIKNIAHHLSHWYVSFKLVYRGKTCHFFSISVKIRINCFFVNASLPNWSSMFDFGAVQVVSHLGWTLFLFSINWFPWSHVQQILSPMTV